ncbi:MAG: hypothetical protein GXP53_01980 [Deltaproteobacteria bacterium]|nr:hypothetical protein [Deltaproteobacteria bacterium]
MPKESKKKINKIDSRLKRTSYGWTAFFMAIPFIGIGSFFALAGFGFIHFPSKANAPLPVIGAMGIAFAVAGLTLMAYAIKGLRAKGRATANRRRFADRPWMLDYPWNPSGIDDRPAARWMNSLLGTILFSAFLVPFNWWAFFSREGVLMVKLITGLFDIILVLIFMGFIYRLFQSLKYGSSRLSFARFPYAPGGVLEAGFSPNCFEEMDVTLRYVEEWLEAHGSGNNRTVRQKSVSRWSETRHILPDMRLPEVAIEFKLPDNREWTTNLMADPRVRYWELVVTSKGPGIDFRTTFPLPVYKIPDPTKVTRARARPRLQSRMLGIPYAVELGLPMLLVIIFLVVWWAAPGPVDKLIGSAGTVISRIRAGHSVHEVSGRFYGAMKVRQGPAGRMWVLSKYKVVRFSGDDPDVLLDGNIYKAVFKHKMNSLSTILVAGAGEAWVGSWYGGLFHYMNGKWTEVSAREKPLKKRIRSIMPHKEGLFLAGSDGLWRFSPETGMARVAEVGKYSSRALADDGRGRLLAGVGRSLWRHDVDGWTRIWKGEKTDRVIGYIHAMKNGTVLLGTHNGLVTLNSDGAEISRELGGRQVTAITPINGRLWIGTWREGVLVSSDAGWLKLDTKSGLPADTVTSISHDGNGRAWITLYGGGVVQVDAKKIVSLLGNQG